MQNTIKELTDHVINLQRGGNNYDNKGQSPDGEDGGGSYRNNGNGFFDPPDVY